MRVVSPVTLGQRLKAGLIVEVWSNTCKRNAALIRKIDDKNAETIGLPFVEHVVHLLAQSDQAQFMESYPGLRVYEGQETFDEAVESLKQMGDLPSVYYLDQLIKPGWNILLWRVKCQDSDKALMLRMELTEYEGDIKLTHLSLRKLFDITSEDTENGSASGNLNNENSESIGTPVMANLLNSLLIADFELYLKSLPEMHQDNLNDNRELFEEAVGVLRPMGSMISMKYLAYARMANMHTQYWKVRYQKEDEDLLFKLTLTNDEGQVHGWGFDR